ncbi:MAG TPA: ATP-binding protein [Thermoanaerobaculia bacterium]
MTASSMQQGKTAADHLPGGGEMGERMRAFDWSKTPVGPIESWPRSLITAVRVMLHSRYPMFIWWGREMINFYNDAYIPILGKRHPEALGRSAPEVWGEIWGTVGPQAEIVLNEGRSTWNEEALLLMERHGYTEETYFTFSYSPAPDDAGGVGGVFCVCTEDTRSVLGERRLRTLRDMSERGLEEAKTVDQVCHAAANELAGNPHDFPFALIYLLEEDGQRVRLCETVNFPGFSGDDVWGFQRVVATGQSQIVDNPDERFGRWPAGPWADDRTTRALVLPLAKAVVQEKPAGFLVAGISPRLSLDNEYRGFLELAAGQLANAIANARSYEEERRRAEALAELDRAKTAFFSNVSHEFRTPLTLMLGPLEDTLAESGELPAADRERLEMAHRNALRLLKLVNTLLDFSRLEAGRLQAAYEPTDLAMFTAGLASSFRSAVERSGLRLVVDCPPFDEPVYVDREMWEKIVLNLLSNAFKFTFEGEIEVRLRRGGDCVTLAVRDTGTGIPPEELPHLFERFHRVRDARGRTFEGSGIGLALVQELARLHGGAVDVESEVDQGSLFIVSIPTGRDHLPADRIGAARTLAPTALRSEVYIEEAKRWTDDVEAQPAETPQERRGRILLADDNADMREYMRRLLGSQYELEVVSDGLSALRAVRERAPDLVLSDAMMPGLDGFDLIRELRADPRTATIPVIMLSARAGGEARVEGLDAGADDYLTKPFAARELLARIEASLKMAALRRQAAERDALAEQTQELLMEIGEKIRLADDAETLLGDVARVVGQRLGLARCAFDEVDVAAGVARVHSDYFAPGLEPGPREWPIASFSPKALEEVRAGHTVVVSDAKTDERTAALFATQYEPYGYLSYAVVPLTREGRWIASLWVNKETPYPWTPREIGLLEAVAERTWLAVERLRSEAALRESERALREADRRKDEFLAMLAHELRNPLAPIRNAAQVLKLVGAAEDGRQRWAREVIERQTQHLTRLVDDLLDVSRITRGKVNIAREPLELATIVHRAVEASRPLIDARQHQLTVALAEEPVRLEGDLTRLVQVLGNLLNNAAKYTDEGGRIHVEAAAENGEAVIRVRDNGMGLHPDLLPHVFDLFTQADRSLDRSQGGLGVGLTLVRRLVELHGGRVEAWSEGQGKGSELTVRLPVAAPGDAAGIVEAGEPAPAAAQGLRILVVEDNVDSAEMMSFLLELRGHQVRTAYHGLEALETARDFNPQAVLCDIGLPGMNGYEVAARLREQPDFQETTLIALTGYGQEDARRRAQEAGFDHHLVKPVEPETLEALLDSLRGGG